MSWTKERINLVGAHDIAFPTTTVTHWNQLRAVTKGVREELTELDATLLKIEQNKDLSAEGIKRQKAAVAKEVLTKLQNYHSLELAEYEAGVRAEKLDQKVSEVMALGKPRDHGEAQVASEIRSFLKQQGDGALMKAVSLKSDYRLINAVLSAPAFLSGMSEDDVGKLKAEVLQTSDPQIEKVALQRAVDVCRSAVNTATTMIVERAGLRKKLNEDGWE
jgi:hypothetical protein